MIFFYLFLYLYIYKYMKNVFMIFLLILTSCQKDIISNSSNNKISNIKTIENSIDKSITNSLNDTLYYYEHNFKDYEYKDYEFNSKLPLSPIHSIDKIKPLKINSINNDKTEKIILEKSNIGNIYYNISDTMIVGKSKIIDVVISDENVDKQYIINKVNTFNNNVFTDTIRISTLMIAKLIDPTNMNFKINPILSEKQFIEKNKITRFQWNVIPLKSGNNELKLTIDIIYLDNCKNIENYNNIIHVYSSETIIDRIKKIFIENWKWLSSTLIIPIFIFLYKKKKKD